MGCFNYFRRRCKYTEQTRSAPTPGLASPTSIRATSRSEESATGNEASKSTASIASQRSIPELFQERAQNLRVFELRELRHATNDFSRLFKIGEGGFGNVYKGSIRSINRKGDNIAVAIKKLNPNGVQGHRQWLAEVQFLGVVEHPNLVKLIGYCSVDDDERGPQRLLVYEFVPNKTLEHHLFSRAYPPIPWEIRLQIALGAAEGLAYLHGGLEVQVIYRDLKASNVLLDEEFKPKLSDFGLARQGPSAGDTHVTTAVMGTYGYAAPDYIESGHLTAKSDVWSFGVVLYEILTGRRSMDRNRPRGEQKLLDWVTHFPAESKRFSLVMDPRLQNRYSLRAARDIATLADNCLAKQAKDRPAMSEVVEVLKKAMQHKDLDGQVELVDTYHPSWTETNNKREQDSGLASAQRRMLHLNKLSENVNTVGKRRFVLMKVANHN